MKVSIRISMNENQIVTTSPKETKKLARTLAKEWLNFNKNKNSNWLVCLYGDLGGGKTTFVKGVAEELGIKETVNSPTFLIMRKYVFLKKTNKKYSLYHFDCYRISNYGEILNLGWEEIIGGENNIIAVEWPEKIKDILPKNKLNIKFEFIGENSRVIKF